MADQTKPKIPGQIQVQSNNLLTNDKGIYFGQSKNDYNAKIFSSEQNILNFKTYNDSSGFLFHTGSSGFNVDTSVGNNDNEVNGAINFKAGNSSSFLVKRGDLSLTTNDGNLIFSSSKDLNISSINLNLISKQTNITNDNLTIETTNKISVVSSQLDISNSDTKFSTEKFTITSNNDFSIISKNINIGNDTLSKDIRIGNDYSTTYIDGDLVVNGTHTTINSQKIFVSDNYSLLNADSDSLPKNAGFLIDRSNEKLTNENAEIYKHISKNQSIYSDDSLALNDTDIDDYKNWLIKIESGPLSGQIKNVNNVVNGILKVDETWTFSNIGGNDFKLENGTLKCTNGNFTSILSNGCSIKCDGYEFIVSEVIDDNNITLTGEIQNLQSISNVYFTSPGVNTQYSLYKRSVVGNIYNETNNEITFGRFNDLNNPELDELVNIKAGNSELTSLYIKSSSSENLPLKIEQSNDQKDITALHIDQKNISGTFLTLEGYSGNSIENNIINSDSDITIKDSCFLAITVIDKTTGEYVKRFLKTYDITE